MLVHLGTLAQARGIEAITWHWPLEGWTPSAPNADPRWRAMALSDRSVVGKGVGHTGQEALENLIRDLEADDAQHR